MNLTYTPQEINKAILKILDEEKQKRKRLDERNKNLKESLKRNK